MRIKKGFILRNVAGKTVVVPVGEMSKEFHGMINLNETGAFLWEFFKDEHSEDEAVKALMNEYEVDENTVRGDVKQFMELLEKNNFVN